MNQSKLEVLKSITGQENVSHETISALEIFSELLLKWNQKINLVSKKITPEELWQRHILDSAQMVRHINTATARIMDFGSGAGFPGLIMAIIGDYNITLVESDIRKCAFLQEVKTKLRLPVNIISKRIEDIEAVDVDIITARALAPLVKLIEYSAPFLKKDNFMLFLKGQNVVEEIKEASIYWDFSYKIFNDALNKEGGVLKISHVRRL